MTPRTVTVDGIRLQGTVQGEGDPILFVHGLGSAASTWEPTIDALGRDHTAVAFDLPGFGRSEKPQAAYTPAFFADVLADLLDALGIEKTHVVGSSLGGHISLELALGHPDRVERVIAVAPGGIPPASFEGTPALLRYRDILDANSEEEIAAILEEIHPDEAPDPVQTRDPAEILAYVESSGAEQGFLASLVGSAQARRLGPLLDEISPRPLLVWGELDPMIPLDVCIPELAEVPDPQVAVFEACGHGPHRERPGTFNELAEAFLAGSIDRIDALAASERPSEPLTWWIPRPEGTRQAEAQPSAGKRADAAGDPPA